MALLSVSASWTLSCLLPRFSSFRFGFGFGFWWWKPSASDQRIILVTHILLRGPLSSDWWGVLGLGGRPGTAVIPKRRGPHWTSRVAIHRQMREEIPSILVVSHLRDVSGLYLSVGFHHAAHRRIRPSASAGWYPLGEPFRFQSPGAAICTNSPGQFWGKRDLKGARRSSRQTRQEQQPRFLGPGNEGMGEKWRGGENERKKRDSRGCGRWAVGSFNVDCLQ
ncbi:hypothetical protein B0T19DRAFT_288218 [Cercophora scortea]|uniref:Uncharacterized protein n=1 Tax=Cercophora scortea TaxID=314031 RepID=A0AAE0M318_9PEZI|nr:hypothetical protein B0T19DRAFT_288218 [Cercophora scortea]